MQVNSEIDINNPIYYYDAYICRAKASELKTKRFLWVLCNFELQ